jgi:hypothetical protein
METFPRPGAVELGGRRNLKTASADAAMNTQIKTEET